MSSPVLSIVLLFGSVIPVSVLADYASASAACAAYNDQKEITTPLYHNTSYQKTAYVNVLAYWNGVLASHANDNPLPQGYSTASGHLSEATQAKDYVESYYTIAHDWYYGGWYCAEVADDFMELWDYDAAEHWYDEAHDAMQECYFAITDLSGGFNDFTDYISYGDGHLQQAIAIMQNW